MSALWSQIRDRLAAEIAEGTYAAGDRLPAAGDLAQRFGVNRHTVRRALVALAHSGVIHLRRGAPATVADVDIEYPIGRRTRFRAGLADSGRLGAHVDIRSETVAASADLAQHLDVPQGAPLHLVERVGIADAVPIVRAISHFPATRLPDLPAALVREKSITGALRVCGVSDYVRDWTRLRAELADGITARHLRIKEGAPVLRTRSVNRAVGGQPVEHAMSWFASDRVQLMVQGDG